jgi:hypothetical protein
VSLILEALRKLEAEKQAPERGFLVVAAPSWPARGPRPRLWLAAAIVVAVGLAGGAALWLRPWGPTNPREPLPGSLRALAPARRSTPSPPSLEESSTPIRRERALPTPTPTVSRPHAAAAPRAPSPATPSPPALVLEAISERDGHPIALVSDHLVREGDGFDGVTIVRIGQAEVEVEWRGERRILHF